MHMVRKKGQSWSSESNVIHSDFQQKMIKVTFAFSLLRLLVHSREVYGFKYKQPYGLIPTTPADVQYKWLKTYPFTKCKLKSAIKLRAVDGHSHFWINILSWFEIWSRAVKAMPSGGTHWNKSGLAIRSAGLCANLLPNRTLIKAKILQKQGGKKEKKKKEKKSAKIKKPPGRLLFNLFHAIP